MTNWFTIGLPLALTIVMGMAVSAGPQDRRRKTLLQLPLAVLSSP
jgi:hypothetical protein